MNHHHWTQCQHGGCTGCNGPDEEDEKTQIVEIKPDENPMVQAFFRLANG